MNDGRVAPRKRVLKAGIIDLGVTGRVDCFVKNISATGAAIQVNTPLFIPDKFRLIVQSEDLNLICRVVWREPRRMGVTFT